MLKKQTLTLEDTGEKSGTLPLHWLQTDKTLNNFVPQGVREQFTPTEETRQVVAALSCSSSGLHDS